MKTLAWLQRQLSTLFVSPRLVLCPVSVVGNHEDRGGIHTGMWTGGAFAAEATTYHSRQRGTVT